MVTTQRDKQVIDRTIEKLREAQIALPTFAQLADPARIPTAIRDALGQVGPDDPHPLNLFRVHWYNGANRDFVDVPDHLVLPAELTGVDATIVVALGDRFPMIGAHKVLAAYGCLAPRVVTGQFDPTHAPGDLALDRKLLPRRGGDLAAHGLPRRRRAARGDEPGALRLARATGSPTPRTSSARPAPRATSRRSTTGAPSWPRDPANVIFNQFSEFGNHLVHYLCTGRALERVFESLRAREPALRLRGLRVGDRLGRHARAPATT